MLSYFFWEKSGPGGIWRVTLFTTSPPLVPLQLPLRARARTDDPHLEDGRLDALSDLVSDVNVSRHLCQHIGPDRGLPGRRGPLKGGWVSDCLLQLRGSAVPAVESRLPSRATNAARACSPSLWEWAQAADVRLLNESFLWADSFQHWTEAESKLFSKTSVKCHGTWTSL